MKILMISDLYPPFFVGGYEINCRDTVNSLTGRNHEVYVLASSWGLEHGQVQDNVFRLLHYDPSNLNQKRPASKFLNFFINQKNHIYRALISKKNYAITESVIRELKPDFVVVWHFGHITISPALCAQDLGLTNFYRVEDDSLALTKLLLNERNNPLKDLYRSWALNKRGIARLKTDHLIMISQAMKDYYTEAGFPESAMKVIPSGLSPSILKAPGSRSCLPFAGKKEMIRLVFAGRLNPDKGPDIAIKAVARLKEISSRPVHLDLIGDGEPGYVETLVQLSARLGVNDRVSFPGKFTSEEVLEKFRSYDALLFPSRWQEPFGRVVIEAMSQGLPVIATRSGGVPEIITDQENGLLIPIDDPIALADLINLLLQDPDKAASLSRNAIDTVSTRFNLEHTTANLEKHFCEVVYSGRE